MQVNSNGLSITATSAVPSLVALMEFEAPWLEEKLLAGRVFATQQDYLVAFCELKKYLYLTSQFGGHLAMIGDEVDKVWHQFILFTREYSRFCRVHFGTYVHHLPTTSFDPASTTGRAEFVRAYKEVFGELPAIWSSGSTCPGHPRVLIDDFASSESLASCDNGGCGKCGGGNGCGGCKSKTAPAIPSPAAPAPAGCSKCNGCGRCTGCSRG